MALSEEDYRNLAASSDITSERRSSSGERKPIPKGAYALLAVAGLGGLWFITQDTSPPPRLTDPDSEQFTTTTPIPPSVPPQQVSAPQEDNRIVIEPEPEVAPPPPIVAPAAPAAPSVQEAAVAPPPMEPPAPAAPAPMAIGSEPQPFDDAEAEQRRWERLRSEMIVMDDSPTSDAGGAASFDGTNPGAAVTADVDSNANVAFLNQQARQGVSVALAGKIGRTDSLILEGTMIKGVLETAIQSDLPGSVRAVVSEDVWSFDGRRILIPRGSRLIGEYSSGIAEGQTRVLIAWNRVVRSDGVSVQLGSIGTDTLGRSGMTGKIDRHILQKYGGAMLLTLIGGGTQYLATLGQTPRVPSQTISRVDPVTGDIITTTIEGDNSESEAREIAARTVSQSIQEMANEALQNSINIPPTIHVNQGERIMIFVRRDLDFSALYEDPVREKMRELRNRNVYK